jgi:predicted dehydrogenase
MKVVQAGEIGKVTFMQGQWHWPWEPGNNPTARDGGEMVEQASHHMDVMSWAMGNKAPIECCSMALNVLGKDPNTYSETDSATTFRFSGGAVFSYTHLFYLPPHFMAEKMWVFGDKGGVDLVEAMYYPIDSKGDEKQAGRSVGESSGRDWGKGTNEELCAFVAHIKSGSKELPAANVETGRICTLMCILARMSMANPSTNKYEPRLLKWQNLGSKTDPA